MLAIVLPDINHGARTSLKIRSKTGEIPRLIRHVPMLSVLNNFPSFFERNLL